VLRGAQIPGVRSGRHPVGPTVGPQGLGCRGHRDRPHRTCIRQYALPVEDAVVPLLIGVACLVLGEMLRRHDPARKRLAEALREDAHLRRHRLLLDERLRGWGWAIFLTLGAFLVVGSTISLVTASR
jgi:hypothetical protein